MFVGYYSQTFQPLVQKINTSRLLYTRVLIRIQPGFTSNVNAPNLDCNPD